MVTEGLQLFDQPVEGINRCIGDVGKDGVLQVVINGFQNGRGQEFPEILPLPVDFLVGPPGEIYPFKRT